MIDKGRTRIALLGSSPEDIRGVGYTEAFEKSGMELDTSLIISEPFGRDLFAYGYEQGSKLAESLEFDGVQCVNDACAIGLIRALGEKGIQVPHDVSVAGFDDIMVSRYQSPALSTVAQPKEELARKTADFLFERMKNVAPPQHVELETEFINRETI
jgi:DNA-binding LacI/PurR family transcriptional regulator